MPSDEVTRPFGEHVAVMRQTLADRGVSYSTQQGREAELQAALTALRDAIDAQNFSSGYSVIRDDPEREPVTFACMCGAMTGEYPNYETANTLLDAHLDEQQRVREAFEHVWRQQHREARAQDSD